MAGMGLAREAGSTTVLDRIWGNLVASDPNGWFAMDRGRNGDFCLSLRLLGQFKRTHVHGGRMHLRVSSPARLSLARGFAHLFDTMEVVPELNHVQFRDVRSWVMRNGLDAVKPPYPIWLNPRCFGGENFVIDRLGGAERCSYPHLMNAAFALPAQTAPSAPVVSDELREQARVLCDKHAIVAGRTVVLFPYAQSMPFNVGQAFEALAKELAARGFDVVTSVSSFEAAIKGTRGVEIPFGILIPVCEIAGHTVALRSGICDILASAKAAQLYIYRTDRERAQWSVHRMWLGGTAVEKVFSDYEDVADYGRIAAADLVSGKRPPEAELFGPNLHAVMAMLERARPPAASAKAAVVAVGKLGPPIYLSDAMVWDDIVLGAGWWVPERWGIWSCGARSWMLARNPSADGTEQTLNLRVRPPSSAGAASTELRIRLGDAEHCHALPMGGKEFDVTVPIPAELRHEAWLRVEFETSDVGAPKLPVPGAPADSRLVGFALVALRWERG